MFDKLFKKKQATPGNPGNPAGENSEEENIEAPEVEDTLADLDAALAKADKVKKAGENEALREKLREALYQAGSRCGCG